MVKRLVLAIIFVFAVGVTTAYLCIFDTPETVSEETVLMEPVQTRTWEAQQELNEALIEATKTADLQRIRELLANGADPNYRSYEPPRYWKTPLIYALQSGKEDLIIALLDSGAQYEPEDLFPMAFLLGQEKLFDYLLSRGVSKKSINEAIVSAGRGYYFHKRTYLFAILFRHYENSEGPSRRMWQKILKIGDINSYDEQGETALTTAASSGSPNMVKMLLGLGADPNISKPPTSKYKPGYTPLLYTTSVTHIYGDLEDQAAKANILIEAGADINIEDEFGFSPFIQAAKEGNIPVMKVLLDAGADIHQVDHRKAKQRNVNPYAHEYYADEHNRKNRYLDKEHSKHRIKALGLGPATDIKLIDGPFGATALIWASALHYYAPGSGRKGRDEGRRAEIDFLLQHGAQVNARDEYGTSALMWAAASGYDEQRVIQLLDAGADINAVDKYGNNALAYPILYGGWNQQKMIEVLLDRGINVNEKNIKGQSAIDLDKANGSSIIKNLLKS